MLSSPSPSTPRPQLQSPGKIWSWLNPTLHFSMPTPQQLNVAGVFFQLFWNKSHFKFMTINFNEALRAFWQHFLNQEASGPPLSLGSPPSPPTIASSSLLLFVVSSQMTQGLALGPLGSLGSLRARVFYPTSWLHKPSICWPFQNSYFQPGPTSQLVSETSSRLIYSTAFLMSPFGHLIDISTLTCSKLSS